MTSQHVFVDYYARAIERHGLVEHAVRVSPADSNRYRGRLPDGLLRFWVEHGRGSLGGGNYWICDPAAFEPVLQAIFAGDPEFDPQAMCVFAYNAFGMLEIWHPQRRNVDLRFDFGDVFNPPSSSFTDEQTGALFPADFSVGLRIAEAGSDPVEDEDGEPLLPQAVARLGPLQPGEIYGFFPAIGFGGENRVEYLRRTDAVSHMLFLAQVVTFHATALTPPEPGHPYGRIVQVRRIGPVP